MPSSNGNDTIPSTTIGAYDGFGHAECLVNGTQRIQNIECGQTEIRKMGLRVEKKCVQRHLEKKDIHGAIIVRVVRSSTTDSPWFLYVEVLRRGSGVVLTGRCVGIVIAFFQESVYDILEERSHSYVDVTSFDYLIYLSTTTPVNQ